MPEDAHLPTSESDTWEPPNRCVRAFIEQAFDVNELRNFCQDYYTEVYRRMDDGESFDATIRRLIAYCEQRNTMSALWANFRRVRPSSSVDPFYQRWQQATTRATEHSDGYAMLKRSENADQALAPDQGDSAAAARTTNLSGRQQKELQVALLSAFNYDTLRQMVRVELDETLDHIVGGSNFSTITFDLIDWAIRTGRLPDLLQGTYQTVPGNPKLNEFLRSLR